MNILIIEDETKTARELQKLLERISPEIEVAAIVPSVKGGIAWLQQHTPPHLIVSDIQLADGLSFDIFAQVPINAPIIFCTAYDEYAIKAFETNGIDYLLKPIDENRLKQAVDKYLKIKAHMTPEPPLQTERIATLISGMKQQHRSTLLVHESDKIIPVSTKDIAFIYLGANGITIHSHTGKIYKINTSLDEMEKQLDNTTFFRANRQFIINRSAIQIAEHFFNRRLLVKLTLTTPEHVVISKIRTTDFLKWWQLS
jgi:DNA-binding LytR/AlgR family response regulator